MDLNQNGLASMLPFLSMMPGMVVAGRAADALVARKCLSLRWTRRLMGGLGLLVPAALTMVMALLDHQNASVAIGECLATTM